MNNNRTLNLQDITIYEADDSMKPLILSIATGHDQSLIEQLISKSKEAKILKFTSKDAEQRFGNIEMYEKWNKKGRTLHWLLGENNDLAGVIWYGESKFPLDVSIAEIPKETFAIRIYDGYSGHGLAVPFMEQSLQIAANEKRQNKQNINGIWLQTDLDNPAAIHVYSKLGYVEVGRDDTRVTMVLTSTIINNMAKRKC